MENDSLPRSFTAATACHADAEADGVGRVCVSRACVSLALSKCSARGEVS